MCLDVSTSTESPCVQSTCGVNARFTTDLADNVTWLLANSSMTVNTTLKNSVALDTLDDTAAQLQALLETVDVRVAVLPDLYSLLYNVSVHIAVFPDTVDSLLSEYLEKFKAVVADYCGGSQGGTVKPFADDPSVHFTIKRLEEVGGPKDKSRTKSVEDGGGLWDPEMSSCRNHTVLGSLRARTCVTSYDPDDFWTVDVLVYIAQMSFAVEVLSRALGETMRGLICYQCDHSII